MARKAFSHHVLHVSNENGGLVALSNVMGVWMTIWAETEPTVAAFEYGGPEWSYLRGDKPRVARVHMTVSRNDGCVGYWHGFSKRLREPPDSYAVVASHAKREGADPMLFDPNFLDEHELEARNRAHMRSLLRCARRYDSHGLETKVLLAMDRGPRCIEDLAAAGDATLAQTTVAALRLWKRGLVRLPLETQFIGSQMLVQGRHRD